MPLGRCAGCGSSGSDRKIRTHVLSCEDYSALFKTDPERCLDPHAEYLRYKREDDTFEARAVRRDVRLQRRFAEMDRLHSQQAARWRRPDLLEE